MFCKRPYIRSWHLLYSPSCCFYLPYYVIFIMNISFSTSFSGFNKENESQSAIAQGFLRGFPAFVKNKKFKKDEWREKNMIANQTWLLNTNLKIQKCKIFSDCFILIIQFWKLIKGIFKGSHVSEYLNFTGADQTVKNPLKNESTIESFPHCGLYTTANVHRPTSSLQSFIVSESLLIS